MFKVKRGNIEAVCYSQKDVDNYIQAGWKLVTTTTEVKTVEEVKEVETPVEKANVEEPTVKTSGKINKYSSIKSKK